MINRAMPTRVCRWKENGAAAMAAMSGWRMNRERNHGATVSR